MQKQCRNNEFPYTKKMNMMIFFLYRIFFQEGRLTASFRYFQTYSSHNVTNYDLIVKHINKNKFNKKVLQVDPSYR